MNVHETLSKYILHDPTALVVDFQKSHGSWMVDENGVERLDCYSQFASQPLGWNHPKLKDYTNKFSNILFNNIANADMYSQEYAEFVEEFASICPFKHFFFVAGGSLAVENALKAAFDWKSKKMKWPDAAAQILNVIHLKEAFHGRSGYTLSLTNTTPDKTDLFPRFKWTRIVNPKLGSKHLDYLEDRSLQQATDALNRGNVAAIIVEPIQSEGGDNHFRSRYLKALRKAADEYGCMLIFDEVQTGMGMTGKWWAWEHFDVKPDLMAFGKKTQVCGFASTEKIDEVKNNVFKVPSRINSTWGGNIADMVRSTIFMKIIKEENLVKNAEIVGDYFIEKLSNLGLEKLRGRGLMIAFDLPNTKSRDEYLVRLEKNMLALKCGPHSVRLRPHLTFTKAEVDIAVDFIKKAF